MNIRRVEAVFKDRVNDFFEITMDIALKILHYMEPMRLLCYNCTVFDYVHGRKGVMELMMWSFRREESFWW